MSGQGSVSQWIQKLARGDQSVAEEQLFQRYFDELVSLARHQLRCSPRVAEDEEDVALSAMDSFFQRAREGQFPNLASRSELWALLVTITTRKAINQLKRQTAIKRGGANSPNQGTNPSGSAASSPAERLMSDQPTPETVMQLAEECNQRLDALNDDSLRKVARMKLEGYTNQEIAQELDVAAHTVGRKLNRIRREWSEELEP